MPAKYYIYQKKIKNDNNLEFRTYLSLTIIDWKRNQEHKFTKFNPVLENL